MTPTAFEFTVTMPGDTRLVGAIRGLTAHAAGYANLADAAREGLAGHVERATEVAIAACRTERDTIAVRFSADAEALTVVISCDAAAADRPPSTADGDVTVDWMTDGPRRICHIRQRVSV